MPRRPRSAIVWPPTTLEVWIGKRLRRRTSPACNAAVVVMTFIVEPGGWRAEKAIPASPRTSPVRGSSAATPPSWAPSAFTDAVWIFGSMVERAGRPARGRERASTLRPASRTPPGVPATCVSNTRSSPEMPTAAPAGYPSA